MSDETRICEDCGNEMVFVHHKGYWWCKKCDVTDSRKSVALAKDADISMFGAEAVETHEALGLDDIGNK